MKDGELEDLLRKTGGVLDYKQPEISDLEFTIQMAKILLASIFGVLILFALFHIWVIEKAQLNQTYIIKQNGQELEIIRK